MEKVRLYIIIFLTSRLTNKKTLDVRQMGDYNYYNRLNSKQLGIRLKIVLDLAGVSCSERLCWQTL
jgi:hypothetical protein